MKEVKCYFNDIFFEDDVILVSIFASYIHLPISLAEEICERLLNSGVVNSYLIPELQLPLKPIVLWDPQKQKVENNGKTKQKRKWFDKIFREGIFRHHR